MAYTHRYCFVLLTSLVIAIMLLPPHTSAQTQTTSASTGTKFNIFTNNADKPLDIEADSIVISDNSQSVIITGDVIITQNQSVLNAEKVVIHYNGKLLNENDKRQPTHLDIDDGLTLKVIEGLVSAKKMTYDFATGIADLEGDIKLLYQGNKSNGEKLVIDTTKGTFHMTSGKNRRVKTRLNLKSFEN